MFILLLIAALILIGIILLLIRKSGPISPMAAPGPVATPNKDRFKVVSRSEVKPIEPRATGIN